MQLASMKRSVPVPVKVCDLGSKTGDIPSFPQLRNCLQVRSRFSPMLGAIISSKASLTYKILACALEGYGSSMYLSASRPGLTSNHKDTKTAGDGRGNAEERKLNMDRDTGMESSGLKPALARECSFQRRRSAPLVRAENCTQSTVVSKPMPQPGHNLRFSTQSPRYLARPYSPTGAPRRPTRSSCGRPASALPSIIHNGPVGSEALNPRDGYGFTFFRASGIASRSIALSPPGVSFALRALDYEPICRRTPMNERARRGSPGSQKHNCST
ncbi:hypothetical protein DFH09DRAFT_1076931 [Mycena vulgaris]|nr:hypothetical protein DFH09DRAFT_1076931 [Mycena vulgaris]